MTEGPHDAYEPRPGAIECCVHERVSVVWHRIGMSGARVAISSAVPQHVNGGSDEASEWPAPSSRVTFFDKKKLSRRSPRREALLRSSVPRSSGAAAQPFLSPSG